MQILKEYLKYRRLVKLKSAWIQLDVFVKIDLDVSKYGLVTSISTYTHIILYNQWNQ